MSTRRGFKLSLIVLASASLAFAVGCGKEEGGGGGGKGAKKRKQFGDRPTDGTGQQPGNGDAPKGPGPKTPGGKGYKEVAVDGGGSIKGTVSYSGAKKMGNYEVDKDTEVCIHNGKPDRSLMVAEGKLQNAVVALAGVTEGKKWEEESVTVDNLECRFEPRMQIGKHKGMIVAKNSDPVLHNTNLVLKMNGTGKTLANIALPKKDQTVEKKLKKDGMVSITCDVHKWMQGWVFVSPHPYAAVTAEDGTFAMSDVPAGEYDAKVWHETLGEKQAKVKVEAGGEATLDFEYTDG